MIIGDLIAKIGFEPSPDSERVFTGFKKNIQELRTKLKNFVGEASSVGEGAFNQIKQFGAAISGVLTGVFGKKVLDRENLITQFKLSLIHI